MKLYAIAWKAIEQQSKTLAEGLLLHLGKKYNLNSEGVREYLQSHGVDIDLWDELTASI